MSPATPDKPRRKAFSFSSEGKRRPTIEFDLNAELAIRCIPEIDGLTLLEFAELAGGIGDDADEMSAADAAKGASAIVGILRTAVVPEDWDRFEAAVKQPGAVVDLEGLSEVASWLVEQYTERPTE